MKKLIIVLCCVVLCCVVKAQRIGNYVNNGSFEKIIGNCTFPAIATYWSGVDSTQCLSGGGWYSVCNGYVPINNYAYQYPHSGNAYMITGLNSQPSNSRGHLKNRLKANLRAGKTYCVRFHVNITDNSTYGIDGFGAYFGDNNLDTITICGVPLTHLNPQVQNPQGNVITDTVNWTAITGTFTANGTEKFLLLGNFLANEDLSTLVVNPTNLPEIYTNVLIDAVSCIELDLPAYAGRDTTIFLNDSVYIGRENDFAIDTGCVWYKLPNTTAMDTISGMWVKPPIGTHTYVVRQELECSSLKWDTVVVNVKNDVGIYELGVMSDELRVYPNPANDLIKIESSIPNEELDILIIDVTGRTVLNKKAEIKNHTADIELNLANGVYILKITNKQQRTISKKLVIAK